MVAHSIGGKPTAEAIVTERRGTDCDPTLVDAFPAISRRSGFWEILDSDSVYDTVLRMQVPPSFDFGPQEKKMDEVCEAIADFIDIRFQQTWNHSRRVASLAAEIARALKLPEGEVTRIRRAGLVHDLGLAALPSGAAAVEVSPPAERAEQIRQHPLHTKEALRRVPAFRDLIPYAVGHPSAMTVGAIPMASEGGYSPWRTRPGCGRPVCGGGCVLGAESGWGAAGADAPDGGERTLPVCLQGSGGSAQTGR